MMSFTTILFNVSNKARAPQEIRDEINSFAYNTTVQKITSDSRILDKDGEIFIKCSARVLSNFGMTRSGPFFGVTIDQNGFVNRKDILHNCWNQIGDRIIDIHDSIIESGYSRDRFLLEISESEREVLIAKIWMLFKQLLPFTMGRTSYGLVGASKILFSVLPEIVLPIDNSQWLNVFKTVDIGDVIKGMALDIQHWERETGERLDEMDPQKRITTLPSVYNVMAMAARP